jgi:small multidrug resistance family-3 protein
LDRGRKSSGMAFLKTFALFALTALAEILGCYLPYLWLRQGRSVWLLVPAAVSLTVFSWLLTFHPTAAGRTYAAYGGVYVSLAIVWLWVVEKDAPTSRELLGVAVCLIGMAIIATAPPPTTITTDVATR